jgi:hypothetical protein
MYGFARHNNFSHTSQKKAFCRTIRPGQATLCPKATPEPDRFAEQARGGEGVVPFAGEWRTLKLIKLSGIPHRHADR